MFLDSCAHLDFGPTTESKKEPQKILCHLIKILPSTLDEKIDSLELVYLKIRFKVPSAEIAFQATRMYNFLAGIFMQVSSYLEY